MTRSRKTSALILILLLIIGGILFYTQVWNKPHRNIAEEDAYAELSSEDLAGLFEANQEEAHGEFDNKTLRIFGTIEEVEYSEPNSKIILYSGISCSIAEPDNNKVKELELGMEVIIKGRYIGYDDMFEEVQLDECTFDE